MAATGALQETVAMATRWVSETLARFARSLPSPNFRFKVPMSGSNVLQPLTRFWGVVRPQGLEPLTTGRGFGGLPRRLRQPLAPAARARSRVREVRSRSIFKDAVQR